MIEEAFFSAASVSSTLSKTVVWAELIAPPAPIASTVAAIETLSGAVSDFGWIYMGLTDTLIGQVLQGHSMEGRTILIVAFGMAALLLFGFWIA